MKKRHEATVARKIMSKKIMLITLCSMLIAVVPPVEAQQTGNVHRIGFLSGTSLHAPTTDGFRQGLRDLGHIEGKNILVEYRFDVNPERFPSHVAELVELKVDVLATGNLAAIRAAKQATKTIPIVMVTTVDPVATGLVDSLAHPGGNITGLTRLTRELSGKRLELLREVVPRMSRVGVLWDADDPGAVNGFKEYDTAARALKIPIQSLQVRSSNPDFEQAFRDATKGRTSALVTIRSALLLRHAKQIAELAIKNRLPCMCEGRESVEAGGLMSYSADEAESFRRAAMYVDKILKGAKPADLPVEQPTKFELVINLKTAKALNITIPPLVLMRATKVIK
jgi:putative tryptophan/tyrosine transport system substrate-binding protein